MNQSRKLKSFFTILIAQIFSFSIAQAQLTPGPSTGGGGSERPPRYNPCNQPADPNCGGGSGSSRPERPERPNPPERPQPPLTPGPSHGDDDYNNPPYQPPHRPERPERPQPPYNPGPSYPTYPSYPEYPSDPYPGYGSGSNWIQSIYPGYISNVYRPITNSCANSNVERIYPQYRNEMYGQRVTLQVQINRSVRDQLIDINQLFRLQQNYAGYRIYSIRGNTSPNSSSRTVSELVVDREVYAYEINPGYDILLNPCTDVYINQYGYSKEIYMSVVGSTYINSIELELIR